MQDKSILCTQFCHPVAKVDNKIKQVNSKINYEVKQTLFVRYTLNKGKQLGKPTYAMQLVQARKISLGFSYFKIFSGSVLKD